MATKTIEISDLNAAIEERVETLGLIENKSLAARTIGVTRQVYEGWLSGRRPQLTAENQRLLAKFLGVSPREILELAGLDIGSDILGG